MTDWLLLKTLKKKYQRISNSSSSITRQHIIHHIRLMLKKTMLKYTPTVIGWTPICRGGIIGKRYRGPYRKGLCLDLCHPATKRIWYQRRRGVQPSWRFPNDNHSSQYSFQKIASDVRVFQEVWAHWIGGLRVNSRNRKSATSNKCTSMATMTK